MSLSLDEIRAELPVLRNTAYLNTGTSGPLPRRSHEAIVASATRQLEEGRINFALFWEETLPMIEALRASFARLIGAGEQEIALTQNTSSGMNISVWGLPWQSGDEVVTTSIEHEGGLLPVYAAARRFGLVVRVVELTDGDDAAAKIEAALTRRTRLVVVSHVSYRNGRVLPVADIAAVTHRAGALLSVDGAQSAGAIPVDVKELDVDFYALPGQKWLCGPEGVGALYVRKERLADLAPTFVGYFSKRDPEAADLSGYFIPAPGAKRYEVGSAYWPALYGMRESLRWLEEDVGYEAIFERGEAITRRFRERVAALPGVTLHTPADPTTLTAFSIENQEPFPVVEGLAEQGIFIRPIPGTQHLRVSTGFFNSEADLERLIEGLEPWLGRG